MSVDFEGHRCVELIHPAGDRLLVTIDKGPRVIGYLTAASGNLFAVLPDAGIDGPAGRFELRGGHRLWVAPEVPEITYLPDDAECSVATVDGALVVTAPDNGFGIERVLSIESADDGFVVDHALVNVGTASHRSVAPWAITQLPAHGTAIVPLRPEADANPLQASHSLVLWPYTDLSDPRLTFGPDHVLVEATDEPAACKIGVRPGAGCIGYLRRGHLFMKEASPPEGSVPDLGAASQVYTGMWFLELESVGALETLAPGESASLRERWSAIEVESLAGAIDLVRPS